ncbi:DUF2178 domain-containing protein [Aminipila terrae]|uniref:DUF2178 domain-containing protein n=1 Tax=Aminipila terrae TaxID=2697030 RepID=A0A6P1MA77_9FIRM|nr:DUF2178 domain-containing protein [Aminipila terrae]QHI71599.1 DUF2178 domain-containing protein [Aminipila terrae]
MKIYDKKKLVYGIMSLLLGLTLLAFGFLKGFDAKSIILCILMLLIGAGEFFISINKETAKKEHIEEFDERNRLILLTSTSRAFHIAKNINFVLMLFFLIVGAKHEAQLIMGVGMGFAFSFSVMMFTDIFSSFYYEKHM